jgi:hypothetical protein
MCHDCWKHTVTISRSSAIRAQSPAVRALAIGLTLLGLCVFAWGLKYKLSLYDPPRAASHQMPAAKLLSSKERDSAPNAAAQGPINPIVRLAGMLGLVLLACAAAPFSLQSFGSLRLAFCAQHCIPSIRLSSPSFVRPPPPLR